MELSIHTTGGNISSIDEDKLSVAIENVYSPAFFIDNSFIVRKINRNYAKLLERFVQFSPERFLGANYFDVAPWTLESGGRLKAVFESVLSSKRSKSVSQFILGLYQYGSIVETIWDGYMSPIASHSGAIEGILVFCSESQESDDSRNVYQPIKQQLDAISNQLNDLEKAIRALSSHPQDGGEYNENAILTNIDTLIIPNIDQLKKMHLSPNIRAYLDIIEHNLARITVPFAGRHSTKSYRLTPRELQIANFIACGKNTKDIADLLHVSTSTVDTHRYNIRKKIGLKNTKKNLQAYLYST